LRQGFNDEAKGLFDEAEQELVRLSKDLSSASRLSDDKMPYYDHLVSFESGRSTIGQLNVDAAADKDAWKPAEDLYENTRTK
jgi:hypothetical protein